MSDEDSVPPPLPQDFNIPSAVADVWAKLPLDKIMDRAIRKSDVDNLYFALQRLIQGQAHFQNSMIAYTNGNMKEANRLNDLARREIIEASNHSKQFMAGVMLAHAMTSSD